MSAFSETAQFEQNSTDSFFVTGSAASIGETPGSFLTSLSNKEQIRLSFPVKNKIRMLPNSSSIYYFNFSAGQWNIPSEAVIDHVGPGGNFSVNTYREDSPGVFVGTRGSRFIEDDIAFDSHGNTIASGSLNIMRNVTSTYSQKISEESSIINIANSGLDYGKLGQYMSLDLPKSSQRNPGYSASTDESFTLPIDSPFLIEKVVMEVPFCLGNGWFQDRTTLCYASSFDYDYTYNGAVYSEFGVGPFYCIDQGGPGITLSLMCQKNYGISSIRDLVSRGLFTHESDADKTVSLDKFLNGWTGAPEEGFASWQANVLGLDTTEIDAMISPQSTGPSVFTGSVVLKTTADISNGCRVHLSSYLEKYLSGEEYVITTEDFRFFMNNLLSSEFFNFNYSDGGLNETYLTGIDTFGRGMTGFSPSGASIFGREYTSPQQEVIKGDKSTRNPYYISDETKRSQLLQDLVDDFDQAPNEVVALAYAFIGSRRPSPYLVYPGEKMLLAASKSRPAMLGMNIDVDTSEDPNAENIGKPTLQSYSYYSGDSYGHDVQFNTGSINITIYGSYVREGNNYVP